MPGGRAGGPATQRLELECSHWTVRPGRGMLFDALSKSLLRSAHCTAVGAHVGIHSVEDGRPNNLPTKNYYQFQTKIPNYFTDVFVWIVRLIFPKNLDVIFVTYPYIVLLLLLRLDRTAQGCEEVVLPSPLIGWPCLSVVAMSVHRVLDDPRSP